MIACLVLAIFFAILESILFSGGILAFLATASLVGSVVFAFQSNPIVGVFYMLGTLVGVPVLLWFFFRWWPRSPMGRRILADPEDDPALQPDENLLALKRLVGKRGVAQSKMMLSGLIEVAGRRINAISETEFMEPGDELIVVRVDGVNVLVRPYSPNTRNSVMPEEKPSSIPKDDQVVEDPFA